MSTCTAFALTDSDLLRRSAAPIRAVPGWETR
jgi:hypothetical protein